MKILNVLGVILSFIGVVMLAYAQNVMETTVEIPMTDGALGDSGENIYNIGLIGEKLNNTIVSGILIISGLVMASANEGSRANK